MLEAGASADDFSGVPDELTFSAGQTTQSFLFTATQDDVDDDERVRLRFGALPAWAEQGSPASTTLHLGDDDDPRVTVEFALDEYSVNEGGSVSIPVRLSADPERRVAIPTSIGHVGGATAADYPGTVEELVFEPGVTQRSFTMTATQDDIDDDDEAVTFSFGTLPPRVTLDMKKGPVHQSSGKRQPHRHGAAFSGAQHQPVRPVKRQEAPTWRGAGDTAVTGGVPRIRPA